MWFWWYLLISDILIPLIMVIAGVLMWKRCPKKINGFLGYRTARSMKNMDTWRFAHEYCGRLWFKIGCVSFIPSLLIHIPFYNSDKDAIGALSYVIPAVQLIILILSIFPTEAALKKSFNEDGTRKEI